jgi:hypothetical protein
MNWIFRLIRRSRAQFIPSEARSAGRRGNPLILIRIAFVFLCVLCG